MIWDGGRLLIQARRIAIFLILISVTVLAERTRLKPATSGPRQDDIKMGLDAAREAEKQLVLIKAPEATTYITSLGNSLAAKAPNDNKFPFTFKIVDDKSINAFALPGGPIYVNRGAIEAADNEAQNAGNLDQATTQFIDDLLKGNPSATIVRSRVAAQVGGKSAQLTELSNASPMGGQESDIVIAFIQPDGTLMYFIEVAPTKDMPQYQPSFRSILDSVRFK